MVDLLFNRHNEGFNIPLCHFSIDEAKSHIGFLPTLRIQGKHQAPELMGKPAFEA